MIFQSRGEVYADPFSEPCPCTLILIATSCLVKIPSLRMCAAHVLPLSHPVTEELYASLRQQLFHGEQQKQQQGFLNLVQVHTLRVQSLNCRKKCQSAKCSPSDDNFFFQSLGKLHKSAHAQMQLFCLKSGACIGTCISDHLIQRLHETGDLDFLILQNFNLIRKCCACRHRCLFYTRLTEVILLGYH